MIQRKISLILACLLFIFQCAKNRGEESVPTKEKPKPGKVVEVKLLEQSELRRPILKEEFVALKDVYYKSSPLTKGHFETIYVESARFNVNPLLVLMKVQVEQGLLNSSTANLEKRLNRACGYGSYEEWKTGTKKYYGFQTQVYYCAKYFNTYAAGEKVSLSALQTKDIDNKRVKPMNGLTYSFFRYCPKYDKYHNDDGSLGTGNIQIPKMYGKILDNLLEIRKKQRSSRRVLITFDDSLAYVDKISDALAKKKVYAIFFLNDKSLNKTVIANGHDIGNHSLSHSDELILKTKAEIKADLNVATTIDLFRPPYLKMSKNMVDALADLKLRVMMGSSFDSHREDDLAYMFKTIVYHFNSSGKSQVFLFHTKSGYYNNLDELIEFLSSVSIIAEKKDVDSWVRSVYTPQGLYAQPQYFGVSYRANITLDQDLTIRSRPGGTYKATGSVKNGDTVRTVAFFDWKSIDSNLEAGKHEWAQLSSGGWIWISQVGKENIKVD